MFFHLFVITSYDYVMAFFLLFIMEQFKKSEKVSLFIQKTV